MQFNKACELEDFRDPEAIKIIRTLEPEAAETFAAYPKGREHRRSWEWQHVLRGCGHRGHLQDSTTVLVVNAGTDRLSYALTQYAGAVFAVDEYGSAHTMLTEPWRHALLPFNPRRLRVQHMSATNLLYEADAFDAVICQRFSSYAVADRSAAMVLMEVERVLKPVGTLVLIFELLVDGGPEISYPGLQLHTPDSLLRLLSLCPQLRLLHSLSTQVSAATIAKPISLRKALFDADVGRTEYPHLVLSVDGRLFTSAVVFLRK